MKPTRTLAFLLLALVGAPSAAAAERGAVPAAPGSQLDAAPVRESFGVRFQRLRQEVAGVPVLGAEAVVTDAPGRRGDLLVDTTHAGITRPPAPSVRRGRALAAARAAAGVTELRAAAQAGLAILPAAEGGRLVWRVVLPARRPLATFEVLVDARTGKALRVRDMLRRVTGAGAVFDPNPVVRQGSRTGLADGNDADSPALTALRTAVTLPRMNADCLAGTWVRATLGASDVCRPDRDWSGVARADQQFEAVMAYFHVDRAQAYIQSLGFSNVMNRQLRVRANAHSQDNSFFDPATGEITLGQGGVDDGEDAEVIEHEYGHAIQEDQIPGFGLTVESGAMGEGFGDYLAASLSARFTPHATFDPCIAEWNEVGFGNPAPVPCLRRTDGALTAPQLGPGTACGAEVHCYGEAWSGALWQIRAALGGHATDRLVIQSHFSLASTSGFQDGSRALVVADNQLYGGANRQFLVSVLAARGMLDPAGLADIPVLAPRPPAAGSPSSSDPDGDGVDAGRDNCPAASNRGQVDWDRDGSGDVCDRSARVRLGRIAVRGRRAIVRGTMRPSALPASAWHLIVRRRSCARGPCRYRLVREAGGARNAAGGVRLAIRLAPGRYRFQAVLRDTRYRNARSRIAYRSVR